MSPAKFCVSMVISDQNINRGFYMSIAKKITSGLISAILLFGLVSCKAETASTFAVITETTAKQFAPVELTDEYSGPVLGVANPICNLQYLFCMLTILIVYQLTKKMVRIRS